jgi:predicted acylesterase/phospholipase RssA
MAISKKLLWLSIGALTGISLLVAAIIVLVLFFGASRPAAPPQGATVTSPWGSMDLERANKDVESKLETNIVKSFFVEDPEEFDPDHDGIRTYNLLALSGGGSNGAFGAGFINGWSASGERPDFKVVTGVSTGALQATAAFLGPEYDYILREVYTLYETEDIYTSRPLLTILQSDSVYDTDPLKQVIDRYVTQDILDAVAAKHNSGRRLFIGTTNMDTLEFIIWNMGEIAASGQPDALKHYRKILLASASIPILFPPVYFEVQADGKKYYEMHSDGGTYAQVFFRGFLLDFVDAMEEAGISIPDTEVVLYVINNGKNGTSKYRQNVTPRTYSIATATVSNLFRITLTSSLFRMYVLANRYDADFNLADIPEDFETTLPPTEFNKKEMQKLFDLGYQMAEQGYEWEKIPPAIDDDEVFQ